MSIKKIAIYILVAAVSLLTLISVLSIWDVFSRDVLGKSLSTIGVVAFGALIVILASEALSRRTPPSSPMQ